MKKMKKILCALLASTMLLTACGAPAASSAASASPAVAESSAAEGESTAAPAEGANKACLITSTARGNEFVDLIWTGFQELEKQGWEIKCIETFETAEQVEQVRAMCAEGYDLIYTNGDDVMSATQDIADELNEQYPDTKFFFLDTYAANEMPNSCTVTIDPFEACFIAGFVAANKTASGKIGLMLPVDSPIMRRFEYGYYAGVDYANKGAAVIKAYTNDFYDTTKGYESTTALLENNKDIDVLIQAAYVSGYGVIPACADKKIPCIGVDNWQGRIDPIVFWSAIKSMDVAVTKTAQMWLDGKEFPFAMEFNLKDGGLAYAEVDMKNLTPELAEQVVKLRDDIISGAVDVFDGKYDSWRVTNLADEGE